MPESAAVPVGRSQRTADRTSQSDATRDAHQYRYRHTYRVITAPCWRRLVRPRISRDPACILHTLDVDTACKVHAIDDMQSLCQAYAMQDVCQHRTCKNRARLYRYAVPIPCARIGPVWGACKIVPFTGMQSPTLPRSQYGANTNARGSGRGIRSGLVARGSCAVLRACRGYPCRGGSPGVPCTGTGTRRASGPYRQPQAKKHAKGMPERPKLDMQGPCHRTECKNRATQTGRGIVNIF